MNIKKQRKDRVTALFKRVIMQYDGIFDPTVPSHAQMLATHLTKSLSRIARVELKTED